MKTCKYYYSADIEQKNPKTYLQLIEDFYGMSEDLKNTSDVLFLLANPKVDSLYGKLTEIKAENKFQANPDKNNLGEGAITFSQVDNKKVYSLLGFVDSPMYVNKIGLPYCTPLNRAEYKEIIKKQNEAELGTEAAELLANDIVNNWDKIAEDSTLLHTIFSRYYDTSTKLKNEVEGTRLESLANRLYDLQTNNDMSNKILGELRYISGKKWIRNLNLKTHLEDLDVDIIGHIDNLVITPDGHVHIINYKITTTPVEEHKEKKYKHEMALLKLMVIKALADKGIGVKTQDISISIIPVYLKYNNNLDTVEDIAILNKLSIGIIEGRYRFEQFDQAAQMYVKSDLVMEKLTTAEEEEINRQLNLIFPSLKISTEGIALTTDNWIKRNLHTRIIRVNETDTNGKNIYYKIIFGENDEVNIYDFHNPLENKEIKQAVQSKLLNLNIGNSYNSASEIVRRVKEGIMTAKGYSFKDDPSYKRCGKDFDKIFKPYYSGQFKDDKWVNDWKIIEDDILLSLNIILFENRHTKLVDVVVISPYDLNLTAKFRGKYNNILGEFIGDNTALALGVIKGTFGNLEMMRTMITLNTIMKKLGSDIKLGSLLVISPENTSSSTIYTFQNAIKNFTKIINIANKREPDLQVKNNFQGVKFYDAVDVFLNLVSRAEESLYFKVHEWGGNVLQDPFADKLLKLEALKRIMKSMENEFGFDALNNLNTYDNKFRVLLYQAVGKAVLQYSNLESLIDYNENDMSQVESNLQSSANISSLNARLITNLFAKTADAIAERAFKATRPVRSYIDDFYKAKGYSNLRNSTIGDLTKMYSRLYEEIDGKKTMRFKNPWTDQSLSLEERVFLKKALFSFAQVRKKMFQGNKEVESFTFTAYDDPRLQEFASSHAWYLEVPLMKASKASARVSGYAYTEWKNRMMNVFHPSNLGLNFMQAVEGLYDDNEKRKVEEDFLHLNISNRYGWYESLNSSSERLIALTRDPNYWETNVETILMNFITAQEEAEQMADFMCQAKAVILTVNTIGGAESTRLKNTLKYITDYISINVYNRSILEETSKKIVSAIIPARHLATTMYIMGNIASMVRDSTEGVLQNFTRATIHYQTNISKKSLAKAYQIVVKNGTFSNVRSLNLLNQLNIKYRISNVDLARIQEVLSSNRGGITNYENWLYATLRRPDFLNRMTLFVARMIEDGVWDALSVSDDGDLQYDWTKDERYSYYAAHKDNPPVNDEKFLHLKGAYYSAILEYNEEHPNNPLNIQDPNVALPSPYTNYQVEGFKAVANSIYGSYDKSTRSMWEFMASGQALGQFTTWMNGMIGNYFRKPGSPTGETELKLATNEVGEFLFLEEGTYNIVVERYREDGSKYYYNEDLGQEVTGLVFPLMKNVPVIGQGIIYSTMAAITKVIPMGLKRMETEGIKGLIDEINKEIIKNPEELKNFKKLFSDIFITLFMASLFHWVITPAYNELKKNRPHDDFLMNSFEDIVYKGTASSYDGFKGPINIITTYGENMNPPAYKVTTKMVTDVLKTTFGDKTLGQLLTLNIPLLRSFRHAYDAYIQA